METKSQSRLPHIDDVKSLVIFLVVMLHSSVTYSGLGSWYVIENKSDAIGVVPMALFGLFNSFNQAWFMGIMFFFGGYFAADAMSRKGTVKFIKDRFLRLGIPLAAYVFIINPLMMYYIAYARELQSKGSAIRLWLGYIATGNFVSGTGPLWFAETLLLFCLGYAATAKIRAVARSSVSHQSASPRKVPSVIALVALIFITAAIAFLVRIPLPIGTDVFNLQICFFPSYIVLFILGIRGFRGGWFTALTSGKNAKWFILSLAAGIPVWSLIMISGGALSGDLSKSFGGVYWQSAAYALWESFVAIGMSVGLTAAFANNRARLGAQGAASRFFARNSFSVFVFHPVFLISLTKLFSAWTLPPLAKAPVIGFFAYSLSMLFAEFVVRRIPGVRKYL
jgi:surface polysaccharide O-acyltransferase-like enzyme